MSATVSIPCSSAAENISSRIGAVLALRPISSFTRFLLLPAPMPEAIEEVAVAMAVIENEGGGVDR